jgi:CBS domain containing-hemolysin-like protein
MITLLALVALCLASWCTALERALRNGPRSELNEHLDRSGRETLRAHLDARMDGAADVISLLARGLQVIFLAVWVTALAGWNPSSVPDWTGRLFAAGISAAPMLWLDSSIIAPAIARWAGGSLLRGCLWIIRIAAFVSPLLTWVSAFVNEVIKRLSGAGFQQNGRSGEAEAELLRSIEAKQREGELAEGARTLIENVFDFTTTDVGEVMTPRTDIEGIEMTDDLGVIRAFILSAGHSRIPVFEEDLDHIAGILYVKDLIPFLGEDASEFELRPLLRRPIVIPETKPVADLLADFQQAEVHMAIVVDEYGGTAGLATIEDVLEEIVGEIYDEHEGDDDEDEPVLHAAGNGVWEVDGRFHIDDFNEAVESGLPEDDEYDTVGGWFTARVGHVPAVGESFREEELDFQVLEAEPTRVIKLRVRRAE